jgi:hypothetical protein
MRQLDLKKCAEMTSSDQHCRNTPSSCKSRQAGVPPIQHTNNDVKTEYAA